LRSLYAVLVLALGCLVAHAETPRDEATRHYQAGAELYNSRRYAEAEGEFSAAYALAPEPALLYNLGRTRAALGHHAEAAETLDRYVATQPPGIERAKVEALAAEEHRLVVVQPVRRAARHARFPYPVAVSFGVAALALGAASLGTGLASQSAYDDVKKCSDGCDGERAYGRHLQTASIVTLAVGSAAFVGGAIAVAIEHRRAR
jgi:tetratricopeptide (TPR) repeat protein